MRVGEPEYAIKFMAKIEEKALPEAASILRESVAPVMRSSGFSEILVVARRREFETVDPEAPAIVGSRVLSRLVAEVPPHESVLGYVRRKLPRVLGKDVPTGPAHGYVLHHKRKKNPAAFERLRRERIAEQERLERLLLEEGDWARVAVFQLDCYGIYGSEADLKADTLDLANNRMSAPHSARLLEGALDHLLLVKLTGIHHTVVHRSLAEPAGEMLAMQIQLAVDGTRVKETAERISRLLAPGPEAGPGFSGALVLGSRREGFSARFDWAPGSLPEHRGEPSEVHSERGGREPRDVPLLCEVVTFWETESDLLAGAERLAAQGLAGEGSADDLFAGDAAHTEYGTLVLRE